MSYRERLLIVLNFLAETLEKEILEDDALNSLNVVSLLNTKHTLTKCFKQDHHFCNALV